MIVYQEQVLAIAQKVAGYSLGKADLLRKAMGKKKREILDAEFGPFEAGMQAHGYGPGAIKALWDILVPFSDYAFNKAHTTGYGLVSYWTAYLKANYPAEYMAALLTSVRDDKDKSALYLNECRRMGDQGPAAGRQHLRRELHPDRHRHPVRPGRDPQRRRATSSRRSSGPAPSAARSPTSPTSCARSTRWSATSAWSSRWSRPARSTRSATPGAACSRSTSRRSTPAIDTKRAEAIGQFDLFGGDDDDRPAGFGPPLPISVEEWDKKILLAYEREMLGLYVSDHPLLGIEHALSALIDMSLATLSDPDGRKDASIVTIGGMVSSLTRKTTRASGEPYAVVVLEDLEGAVELMVFPALYRQVAPLLAEDVVIVVKGRVREDDDGFTFLAMEVSVPDLDVSANRGPVVVTHAGPAVHPAGGRAAQGRAAQPPRRDRGAPAARVAVRAHAHATGPGLAGRPVVLADGRPQGAARPRQRELTNASAAGRN